VNSWPSNSNSQMSNGWLIRVHMSKDPPGFRTVKSLDAVSVIFISLCVYMSHYFFLKDIDMQLS